MFFSHVDPFLSQEKLETRKIIFPSFPGSAMAWSFSTSRFNWKIIPCANIRTHPGFLSIWSDLSHSWVGIRACYMLRYGANIMPSTCQTRVFAIASLLAHISSDFDRLKLNWANARYKWCDLQCVSKDCRGHDRSVYSFTGRDSMIFFR